MRLTRARVTNYKSIDDSGWVSIDDVTCMVGKNESGKSAFLHAIKQLNPVSGGQPDFDLKDYPRKGYVRYKRSHAAQPAVVVQAEFELSQEELGEIEAAFGKGVLKSATVIASVNYENRRFWELDVDGHPEVGAHWSEGQASSEPENGFPPPGSLDALAYVSSKEPIGPSSTSEDTLGTHGRLGTDLNQRIANEYLDRFMPRFVYFDDYSTMGGRISIQDLIQRRDGKAPLTDADRTFLSLLSLVSAELEDLENDTSYEHLKAELESASIGISDEIFEFWNQNKQLRVEFDLSVANPADPPPLNSGTILHVRIWNDRHRVSVPFDERSKGFVWFFSFLAYFSKLEEEENADLILLLDEPGLNLHAMAQTDFLRFIDERLAPRHQVVYTTHSPFMINLEHLSRVRTVQDVDDAGTVISDDVFGNDHETVFPVQVSLAYQMAQTLFLAPHCLLVNAASDLIYLQVLGEIAAANNQPRLDPRWVIIPVGGTENLPTFVSLLGESYVSVAVMMDVTPKSKERLDLLNQRGVIVRRNPIKWVEVTRARNADIEDLLDPDFYLKLVNACYDAELPGKLTLKSITDSNPRIVQRVSAYFRSESVAGGKFDAYRPAAYLLRHHAEFRDEIDEAAMERVGSLFERVNSLLPLNGRSAITNGLQTARVLASTS